MLYIIKEGIKIGIMDIIRKWNEHRVENKKEFKQKVTDAQQERRIEKTLNDREKSSNERELEKYMKQQRELRIKDELDRIHQKQTKENWKGSMSKEKMNILKNDKPILKEKNIFLDNKSKNPMTQRRMYFK